MAFSKDNVNSKVVPENVINLFFDFIEQQNKTVKRYYDVEGDVKMLVREVEEIRPNDLKASLALFEKLYPEYFDQLTIERLEKLRADTGEDKADEFKKLARKMLTLPEAQ